MRSFYRRLKNIEGNRSGTVSPQTFRVKLLLVLEVCQKNRLSASIAPISQNQRAPLSVHSDCALMRIEVDFLFSERCRVCRGLLATA